MARVAERTGMKPAEFLKWEESEQTRHEYFLGEAFAMAGGSPRHNALCVAVGAVLYAATRGGPCRPLSSDQKLGFGDASRYVYPDVTVVCGPLELEAGTRDVLVNPTVIVEVLSAATEQYDRGLKWTAYQRIASLKDYVLVSQDSPRIECFSRDPDGSFRYRTAGPGGRLVLSDGAVLEVDVLFEGMFDLAGN